MHFLYLLIKAGILSVSFSLSAFLIYLVIGYVTMMIFSFIKHSDSIGFIILSCVLTMTILTWIGSLIYFLFKIQKEMT